MQDGLISIGALFGAVAAYFTGFALLQSLRRPPPPAAPRAPLNKRRQRKTRPRLARHLLESTPH